MKRRALKIYVLSAIGGLALAITVGAIASNMSGHPQAAKRTQSKQAMSDALVARERPDVALMKVFSSTRTRSDALPPSAVTQAESIGNAPNVDPSVLPGTLDVANAHLAATLSNGWQLFGMPSAKGWLCAILVGPKAGGGCFLGYSSDQHVLLGLSMDDNVQFVWGFLRNDVKSATISDAGINQLVAIGRNGFLYRAAEPGVQLTSMTVHLANGTTQTVPFGAWPSLPLKSG